MHTLTSVLSLDLPGLSASLGSMFRGLTALLPDLALKGGLLLLIALAVDAVLRRASAATRHAHWQLALGGALALVLLLPLLPRVSVELPLPAALAQSGTWFGEATSSTPAPTPTPATTTAPAMTPPSAMPLASRRSVPRVDAPPAARVPLHQRSDALAVRAAAEADDAAPREFSAGDRERAARSTAGATASHASRPASRWSVGAWLTLAWAAGAALVLVLTGVGLLRARAMARAARPVLDPAWLALLSRTSGELSLRRRVTLLIADGPVVPMTWGHAHPVILLPADAGDWSAPRRRQVLLHELAHIQRGDWLTQVFAQVACALYWYQPLAWLGARRLRQQREHACDDRVLAAGNRASDYAGHLLDIARTRQTGWTGSFATLAMARRSQLEGRLLAVLDERRDRRALPGRRTLAAGAVAVTLVLALACVQGKPVDNTAPPPDARTLQVMNQRGFGRPTTENGDGPRAAASDEALADANQTYQLAMIDDGSAHAPGMQITTPSGAVMLIQDGPATGAIPPQQAGSVHAVAGVPARAAPRAGIARSALSPVAQAAPLAATAAVVVRMPQSSPAALPARAAAPARAPLPPRGARAGRAAAPPLPASPGEWSEADPFDSDAFESNAGAWGVSMGMQDHDMWRLDGYQAWNWTEGGETYHVTQRDCLDSDETGTKLSHVGDGAELVVERTHDGATDRIVVTGGGEDENGVSLWSLSGTLAGAPADAPALQAELDRLMPGVLAHTGMFTSQRIDWLLNHGGISAVLAEVAAMPEESTRAGFYETLFTEHELDAADTASALSQVGTDLPSDAFLADLLDEVGAELLADPDLAGPLFAAVDSLESDAYQAQVLESLLSGEYVDGTVLVAALQSAARGLESDSCAADVLAEVPGTRLRDPAVRTAFLAALDTVGSDAYRAEVIAPLLDQRGVKGETLAALLSTAATSVESDARLADVLQQLPARALSDASVRAAVLVALASIDSDAYLAETLQSFLGDDDLPRAALGDLLDAAARGIDGDAAMAEVLASVPPEALTDAALRAHFDAALATIESPSYRAGVLEELDLAPQGN